MAFSPDLGIRFGPRRHAPLKDADAAEFGQDGAMRWLRVRVEGLFRVIGFRVQGLGFRK